MNSEKGMLKEYGSKVSFTFLSESISGFKVQLVMINLQTFTTVPVFDCLQYAKTKQECLGDLVTFTVWDVMIDSGW